jgi:hypothetical protein
LAASIKKAVVERFNGATLSGFVHPQTGMTDAGVDLLDADGTLTVVPWPDVRAVCFVRDFPASPESEQWQFVSRPKLNGLWVRLTFRDGAMRDGIVSNNLLSWNGQGVTLTPPNLSSNIQHLFVPRSALQEASVLGVVGSPLSKTRRRSGRPERDQLPMFE